MSITNIGYAVRFVEVVGLGVANVCSFVPTIVRVFIMRNAESYHRDPVSDIPGNPHAFSPAIISLFRTLPEPSNFNIVWTGLNLKEPLLVRGCLPMARFSSLSVYGAGSADTPNSAELNSLSSTARSFDLVIAQGGAAVDKSTLPQGAIVVRANDWQKGFVAMRNYLVPPGTRVVTPEIVRLRDGVVVRPAIALTAGPCGLDLRASKWAQSLVTAAQINAAVFVASYYFFNEALGVQVLLLVPLLGAVVGYALYSLCFIVGKKRLTQLTKEICKTENAFHFASLEQGSKASQPSKLHKYWMMRHDVSSGEEIVVKARINPSFQKYWSLVVYDEYGLPLSQYVYDDNCFTKPVANGKGVYEVDIRLRRVTVSSVDAPPSAHVNLVDVSSCPRGYVLFRVNHPVGEHVVEFSTPVAELRKL
jgi:uncharacterized membrane protein